MVEGYSATAFIPRLAPNIHPITPNAGVMGAPGAEREPGPPAPARLSNQPYLGVLGRL